MRSMEAVLEMSMLRRRKSFEQSALPSQEQLEAHVDAETFLRLVVRGVFLGRIRDQVAREIHEEYRRNQKERKLPSHPSMADWGQLAADLKKSNLGQADHIPVKLDVIGCDFRPVRSGQPESFKFTAEEIELLAEMEHERWMEWCKGQGKAHPNRVPWAELPDDVRKYDREAVEAIPSLLARTGLEIYRVW